MWELFCCCRGYVKGNHEETHFTKVNFIHWFELFLSVTSLLQEVLWSNDGELASLT